MNIMNKGGGMKANKIQDKIEQFDEDWNKLFGFKGNQERLIQKGTDIYCDLMLDLKEVAIGAEKTIEFEKQINCPTCKGNGYTPATSCENCHHCNGIGTIAQRAGFLTIRCTCPYCRGAGKVICQPCVNCKGTGRMNEKKCMPVKVPPGVDNGYQLRV